MHFSCNSFSLSGVQGYQDLSTASQTLLTKFKLHQSTMQVTYIKMPPISLMCRKFFLICINFVSNKLIIFLVVFYLFHRIA